MSAVQFGVFENFKGRGTLLIWGDDVGLALLHAALRELAVGSVHALSIHQLSWAKPLRGVQFFLSVEAKACGAMQLSASDEGMTVDW